MTAHRFAPAGNKRTSTLSSVGEAYKMARWSVLARRRTYFGLMLVKMTGDTPRRSAASTPLIRP
jgi:hypothetical protein